MDLNCGLAVVLPINLESLTEIEPFTGLVCAKKGEEQREKKKPRRR